jgi:hypothetical protein
MNGFNSSDISWAGKIEQQRGQTADGYQTSFRKKDSPLQILHSGEEGD